MKLSTKGRYGLRMLIDLYDNQSELPVTLASIADRQSISVNYLEQVASDLKRAGYIYSIKGANGGYTLSRAPKDIIIGNVLRSLEGDIRLTELNHENESLLQSTIRELVYDKLNTRN